MQTGNLEDRRNAILLLIFGGVGILVLLGRGLYLLWSGMAAFTPSVPTASGDLADDVLNATGMFFCALLLVPLMVYNLQVLRGREHPPQGIPGVKIWQVAVLAAVWLAIAVTGSLLGGLKYGWIALIPVFPLGLALPVLGLAWIATGGIPTGSRRRLWSVFGIGLFGSTTVALLAEFLMIVIAAAVFGLVALGHPDWLALVQKLKDQVTNATDLQSAVTALAPYLTNPFVFLIILAGAAGFGPLIEEAAKPLAVWLLGKHLRSTGEGFVLGALCGAGFALLEGLMAASGASQMWGLGMAARVASSLMHITASGIAGWGIASARLNRNYVHLAAAYLTAVGLHGLWNGGTLLAVFGALRLSLGSSRPDVISTLITLAGVGTLLLLFPLILVALPIVNRRLRPPTISLQPPAQPRTDV